MIAVVTYMVATVAVNDIIILLGTVILACVCIHFSTFSSFQKLTSRYYCPSRKKTLRTKVRRSGPGKCELFSSFGTRPYIFHLHCTLLRTPQKKSDLIVLKWEKEKRKVKERNCTRVPHHNVLYFATKQPTTYPLYTYNIWRYMRMSRLPSALNILYELEIYSHGGQVVSLSTIPTRIKYYNDYSQYLYKFFAIIMVL